MTANLSELTKVTGAPAKINLLNIRGDWTDGNGYIDISPNMTVFENVMSTRSLANANTSRAIELSETLIIDFAFEPGQSDREFFAFGDNSWSNFYGNYGIYVSSDTGSLSNKDGISFEVVAVAHFILTINISELTVKTGTHPISGITLFILSGGKTGVFTVNVL